MTNLHSSMIPRGTPLAKTVLGRTRADDKAERDRADDRQWEVTCKVVDARDGGRCRVCGRRCSPVAVSINDRAERHHIIKRSQGGTHEPANVITLCRSCHEDEHVHGVLKLTGDASAIDERGRFCGVVEMRQVGDVWQPREIR